MFYANLSQTKKAWVTDGTQLFRYVNGQLEKNERPPHELKNQIDQIIENNNKFDSIDDAILFLNEEKAARNKFERERSERNKKRRDEFISNLSPFWQDVHNKVGFEVITPFVNRYPGLTFTPYDAGFIWVKEIKTAIKLQDFKSSAYLPRSCKNVIQFGAELDHILKI
jgi:hypothetical protein